MKGFAIRLIGCRARQGLTQQELADRLGVSLRSVQNWEAGERTPHGATLRRLAETLRVSIPYLSGESDENLALKEEPKFGYGVRQEAQPPLVAHILMHKVPVISWTKAGEGGNYYDVEHYLEEEVASDCPDPNAYALIVDGDSMEPMYKPGDRIIVTPNDEARSGDVVVARLVETGQVFLKVLHINGRDGDLVRLTSYNPVYLPLEYNRSDFRFIHPVYGMFRKARSRR